MWALTDGYYRFFSDLISKNEDLQWILQDLPWESVDDLQALERSKGSKGSFNNSSSSGSNSRSSNSTLDSACSSSFSSSGTNSPNGASSSSSRSSSSSSSSSSSRVNKVSSLGLGANTAEDTTWYSTTMVESVQPLQTVSPPALCPRGGKASVGRKRLAPEKNSAGLLSLWDSLNGTSLLHEKKAPRRVSFSTTAQCVLIPSRSDLQQQGLHALLWFPEEDLDAAKREAQSELQMTLASNSSNLSLYAAMSLLYRPCLKGSNDRRDHFRILIVDDSTVARSMLIHNIVTGHKHSGAQEHLYVHQADSLRSACDSIHMHTYNLICVDQFLNGEDDRCNGEGSTVIAQARKQFENCIIIGMSSSLDLPNESTELGRATRNAMKNAGADVLFRKPLPVDMWAQLVELLPVEF